MQNIDPKTEEALRRTIRQAATEAASAGKSVYLAAFQSVTGKTTYGFLDLEAVRKLIDEELKQ